MMMEVETWRFVELMSFVLGVFEHLLLLVTDVVAVGRTAPMAVWVVVQGREAAPEELDYLHSFSKDNIYLV